MTMRVLLSAYSCEPGKGSEPGAGYAVLRAVAEFADCWVITRSNNIDVLQDALDRHPPEHSVTLVGLDGPRWALWLKKKRGLLRLYYAYWQRLALRRARELDEAVGGFDVGHHATMSGFWLPVGIVGLERPLVLGPISGGTFTPLRFWRYLGARTAVLDLVRWAIAVASAPAVKRSWRGVDVVIAQNAQMERFAAARLASSPKAMLRSSHALHPHLESIPSTRPRKAEALFVGRIVGWKGLLLAVEAFARADLPVDSRLVFIGDGPDIAAIRKRADRLGISERVDITGPLSRTEVVDRMRAASCLLFPSFHDSAGFVVSEALSLGLPVVCLDHGGPGEIVRQWVGTESRAVAPQSPGRTIDELAAAVSDYIRNPRPMRPESIDPVSSLTGVMREAYGRALGGRD